MATDPSELDDLIRRLELLSQEDRDRLIEKLESSQSIGLNGQHQRSLFDAFNKRGMVGSISNAPSDLSSNPKYMEGFGQNDK